MVWSPLICHLTTNQRVRAIGMLDAGMSVRREAQTFNISENNHSTKKKYVNSVKIKH